MEEKKYVPPGESIEPYLLEKLKDPELAAELLNTAIDEYLEDGDTKSFIATLSYIVKAGNISQIARESEISRNQLYMIIDGKSEPTLSNLLKLFKSLGFQFEVKPIKKSA